MILGRVIGEKLTLALAAPSRDKRAYGHWARTLSDDGWEIHYIHPVLDRWSEDAALARYKMFARASFGLFIASSKEPDSFSPGQAHVAFDRDNELQIVAASKERKPIFVQPPITVIEQEIDLPKKAEIISIGNDKNVITQRIGEIEWL